MILGRILRFNVTIVHGYKILDDFMHSKFYALFIFDVRRYILMRINMIRLYLKYVNSIILIFAFNLWKFSL